MDVADVPCSVSGDEADADARSRSIVLVTPDEEVTCSTWADLALIPIFHDLKPDTFVANSKVGIRRAAESVSASESAGPRAKLRTSPRPTLRKRGRSANATATASTAARRSTNTAHASARAA